jgi:hypothetical protein
MTIASIPLSEKLINELLESFQQGPIVTDDGRRFVTEEVVARSHGMTINIYSNEHPPPHFHVRYNGESASFALTDGNRLPKEKGLEKYEKNIRKWYEENLCALIDSWNRNRPSDCPVGPVDVPPECAEQK